ncbi:MAG: L,D-transpeptidase [Legionellaceae bacterium]|nr:L,D-transpeptidase [Legionellaceae bacterium]
MNIDWIKIKIATQTLETYQAGALVQRYSISTAKNGAGEWENSECTPRGQHHIYAKIGADAPLNSVFVARRWTGEIYSPVLHQQYPERDWILTRILRLAGDEPGRNKGGQCDSLNRYIYIHGTPDCTPLGTPGSRGCIRMANADLLALFAVTQIRTPVMIE